MATIKDLLSKMIEKINETPEKLSDLEIDIEIATTPTDEEMVELLMDTDIVDPAANSAGAIYTDNNGKVYIL